MSLLHDEMWKVLIHNASKKIMPKQYSITDFFGKEMKISVKTDENGEITDLLRDIIVMGIAPEFFKSIDVCGNDFTIRPITNYGKGNPMQSMIMRNGGPSIRGIATVKSVN